MQFSVAESKLVSENVGIEPVLPERRQRKRKRKQFADESLSVQGILIAARKTILGTTYITCSWTM